MDVSVIIPSFNRAQYLHCALDSVFRQSYSDFEVILVDDGSTDDTRQIVDQYSPRVEYVYQENRGRAAAKNKGVEQATGEYIAFLDSDDLWHPDHLERLMAFFEKSPDSVFVHGPVDVIGEDGKKDLESTRKTTNLFNQATRRGFRYENLLESCLIFTSAILVKRNLFASIGLFDQSLWTLEDLDWYLRVAQQYKIDYLDGSPVASYRLHQGNAFRKGDRELLETYERIFSRHLGGGGVFSGERTAVSKAHLSLSFCYAGLDQPKRCRHHMMRAFALNPRSLLNGHVIIRLLKSFLH